MQTFRLEFPKVITQVDKDGTEVRRSVTERLDVPDCYAILGIPKNADTAEISAAYKKKALEFHPDQNQGYSESNDFQRLLNLSFDVLQNPRARAALDRVLREQRDKKASENSANRPDVRQNEPKKASKNNSAPPKKETAPPPKKKEEIKDINYFFTAMGKADSIEELERISRELKQSYLGDQVEMLLNFYKYQLSEIKIKSINKVKGIEALPNAEEITSFCKKYEIGDELEYKILFCLHNAFIKLKIKEISMTEAVQYLPDLLGLKQFLSDNNISNNRFLELKEALQEKHFSFIRNSITELEASQKINPFILIGQRIKDKFEKELINQRQASILKKAVKRKAILFLDESKSVKETINANQLEILKKLRMINIDDYMIYKVFLWVADLRK